MGEIFLGSLAEGLVYGEIQENVRHDGAGLAGGLEAFVAGGIVAERRGMERAGRFTGGGEMELRGGDGLFDVRHIGGGLSDEVPVDGNLLACLFPVLCIA